MRVLPRGRRKLVALAGGLVLALAAATGVVVAVQGSSEPTASLAGTSSSVSPSRKPSLDPAAVAERRIVTEVTAVLRARARAVTAGRLPDFLATVDPKNTALRRNQTLLFTNLRKIGLVNLRYELRDGFVPEAVPERGPNVYVFRVAMAVQVRGVDRRPRYSPFGSTLARRGTKWLLVADDDLTTKTDSNGYEEPWNFGPIDVVRRPKAVVVVAAGERRNAERLARAATTALGDVRRSLGRAPSAMLLVALRDKRSMGGAETGGHPAAAVAVPDYLIDYREGDPSAIAGSHVVIQPSARFKAEAGMLAHEFTHATMSPYGQYTPNWLVEGLAEYVWYSADIRNGYGAAVRRERDRILRTSIPKLQVLPIDGVFHGDYGENNYGISWVLVEYLANKYGIAKVLAAYRDLGGDTNAATNQDPVLRKRFGVDERGLVAAVHRYDGP